VDAATLQTTLALEKRYTIRRNGETHVKQLDWASYLAEVCA